MATGLTLLLLAAGASALLAAMLPRRVQGAERALRALLPLALLVAWYLLCTGIGRVVHSNWDAARLTFAFAFARGYELYYLPGEGPLLPSIYGPFLAFTYLPATLFPRPTSALIAGYVLTLLLAFGPVLAQLARVLGRHNKAILAALFLAFCFAAHMHTSLLQGMTFIHAEAPAIGYAALGVLFLNRARTHRGRTNLAASALFVVFSVWTKQTFLPLLVGLPLAAWAMLGARRAGQYLAFILASFLGVFVVMVLLVDVRAMWFNMVTVPSRHAWIGSFEAPAWQGTYVREAMPQIVAGDGAARRVRILSDSLQALVERNAGLLVVGALVLAIDALRAATLQRWLRALPGCEYFPWLAAAVFLLPASVLGPVKLGGAYNTQAPAIAFWAAAIAVALAEHLMRDEKAGTESCALTTAAAARAVVLVVLVAGIAYFLPRNGDMLERLALRDLADNAQEAVFAHESRAPGLAYFPENPLPVLMASGTLHHFYNGVEERNIAGFPVAPEHYRAHVPHRARYIAWSAGEGTTPGYIPYTRPAELMELPGFTVHAIEGQE